MILQTFGQTTNEVRTLTFYNFPNDTVIDYFSAYRTTYSYNTFNNLTEEKTLDVTTNGPDLDFNYRKFGYNSAGFLIYEINIFNDTSYFIYRDNLNRDTLTIYSNLNKFIKYFNASDTVPFESLYLKFDTLSSTYSPLQKHSFSYDSIFRINADTLFQYVTASSSWNAINYLKYFYNVSGKLIAKKEYIGLGTIPYDCDTFIYDVNNQLFLWRTDNCFGSSTDWLYRNYYYNNAGKLIRERHEHSGYSFNNCSSYNSYENNLEYDASGRLVKEVILRRYYTIPCNLTGDKSEKYTFYSTASNLTVDLFIPPKFKATCTNILRPVYAIPQNATGPVFYQWNHTQLSGVHSTAVKLSPVGEYELAVDITDSLMIQASNSILLDDKPFAEIISDTVSNALILRNNLNQDNYQYEWYRNGIIIPGITDSFLVVSLSGIYYFVAINQSGCRSASEELEIVFAINSGEQSGIYYSNVNSEGNLIINLDPSIINLQNVISLEIINYSGKIIRQQIISGQSTSINLSGISHGLYLLRLSEQNEKVHVGKVIF